MVEANVPSPFMLYVVWHREYDLGAKIAKTLHNHFGSHRYRNIAGGAGVRVIFRNSAAPDSQTPIPVDWDSADTTATVTLIDRSLANDRAWVRYVIGLSREADVRGFRARVFPVEMEAGTLDIGIEEQAFRWVRWTGTSDEREQRLIRDITHEFCRMLRHHLAQLQHPDAEDDLEQYLKKVNVFLSHSKHDGHGELVAEKIRDWFHSNSALSSFLDVHDIPAGLPFSTVINHSIQDGILVAVYTDSYSSREWCRHEVIRAKLMNVPMLVVDCLQTLDERAFPYLGNVPFIRMDPDRTDRIDQIAGILLDETFKDFLWRCRVERLRELHPQTMFTARSPELISLASFPDSTGDFERVIVYPDPPLGTGEARLFSDVAHNVSLYNLTEWLAEVGE